MRSETRIMWLCGAIVAGVLPVMLACGTNCEDDDLLQYRCDCCHGPGCIVPGEKMKKWSTAECASDENDALVQVMQDVEDRSPKGTTDWSCTCEPPGEDARGDDDEDDEGG